MTNIVSVVTFCYGSSAASQKVKFDSVVALFERMHSKDAFERLKCKSTVPKCRERELRKI